MGEVVAMGRVSREGVGGVGVGELLGAERVTSTCSPPQVGQVGGRGRVLRGLVHKDADSGQYRARDALPAAQFAPQRVLMTLGRRCWGHVPVPSGSSLPVGRDILPEIRGSSSISSRTRVASGHHGGISRLVTHMLFSLNTYETHTHTNLR